MRLSIMQKKSFNIFDFDCLISRYNFSHMLEIDRYGRGGTLYERWKKWAMMKHIATILIILFPSYLQSDSEFIIQKESMSADGSREVLGKSEVRKSKEKKYSQLHQELLEEYEHLMRCHAQCLRKIADAEEKCIDAFKKTIENSPKIAREHMRKERERLQKMCNTLEFLDFF